VVCISITTYICNGFAGFIGYTEQAGAVVDARPTELAEHIRRDRYGDFRLTRAIRPGPAARLTPQQGYRRQQFHDAETGARLPMLAAAVSCEQLFDTFLELLEPLGGVVDAILETSHHSADGRHQDLIRQGIDLPVLMSCFCDHEELFLDDGCTGVAVLSEDRSMEVQFDEHKLLVVYAQDLRPFEQVLQLRGIRRWDRLKLLTEAEHLHCSQLRYAEEFEQLANRLGVRNALQRVRG
jgi:hypothetical protein